MIPQMISCTLENKYYDSLMIKFKLDGMWPPKYGQYCDAKVVQI